MSPVFNLDCNESDKKILNPYKLRREMKLSREAEEAKLPVDLFRLLVKDDMVENIVQYTNDKIAEDHLEGRINPQVRGLYFTFYTPPL